MGSWQGVARKGKGTKNFKNRSARAPGKKETKKWGSIRTPGKDGGNRMTDEELDENRLAYQRGIGK